MYLFNSLHDWLCSNMSYLMLWGEYEESEKPVVENQGTTTSDH